jgi:hypothetical protein
LAQTANSLDIEVYFSRLAHLMKANPPAPQDAATLDRPFGFGAGTDNFVGNSV